MRNAHSITVFSAGLLLMGPVFGSTRQSQLEKLPPAGASQVDFKRDIEPIFLDRCVSCHGDEQQSGGLRLDNKAGALTGGNSGSVIRPGNSAQSRMIHLVAGIGEIVMPMAGERLTGQQVGLLRAWIDQGAEWPEPQAAGEKIALAESPSPDEDVVPSEESKVKNKHWSFLPIAPPEVPRVGNQAWMRNPIDAFILARLEKEGIEPSAVADPATLIRRVSLD